MDNKPLNYQISKCWTIILFVYYCLIIIVGVGFLLYYFIEEIKSSLPQEYIKKYTFIVSILASAMMSAVRYSQKLYKACIDGRVAFKGENKSMFIGNSMYFFLRPVYSVTLAVVFVVCLIGGLFFLMNGLDCIMNVRMVYLSAIVSAFIGYSIGSAIDAFETISKNRLSKLA